MLTINRFSNVPVYEQIINAVERDVMLGAIKENDKLPSVRELAEALDINPNTVQKAYAELHTKGVIITVASSGAFVANGAAKTIKAKKEALLLKIRELSTELSYAGFDEKTVMEEVKRAFSSPLPEVEETIITETKAQPKRRNTSAKNKLPSAPKTLPKSKKE